MPHEFAPQGTADQNFAFVRALNAATFLKAKGVPSRGAITYTATFTPFELKAVGSTVPGVDPKKFWQFVGNEGTPASPGTLMGPFKPTNKNTVVLNSQCQPVTSHPGDPR